MTRSKVNVPSKHQERHVSRNGQHVIMKKMGAGMGNWGILGDEIPDVQEYAHDNQVSINTSKMDKVSVVVDTHTFDEMRST